MAKQSRNQIVKRQKELERKRKADEKMARRQKKKNEQPGESNQTLTDQS